MLMLYGIKNCDTVKKARHWLEDHGIKYQFHDFRQDGLDQEQLSTWIDTLGWKSLVNKRSTTWRNLSEKDKTISTHQQAIKLLLMHPTLIKRPVLQNGEALLVGFNETDYKEL